MDLRSKGQGLIRRPSVPNGPTVEVLFGGDGPDVGFLRIEVPPGAGMPEHDHGGSDMVLHTAVVVVAAGPPVCVSAIRNWPA